MGGLPLSPVLLDTHVLVWLMAGNPRLGEAARRTIQQSAREDCLYISAITPWEIATLVSKGRLALDRDVGEWMHACLALSGVRLEPLSPAIAVASTRLPGDIHADPADRIIAATARHLGAVLISDDRLLQDYAAAGHLKILKAET
jgi:PIN domain nuclease of toxin-antitoxin system